MSKCLFFGFNLSKKKLTNIGQGDRLLLKIFFESFVFNFFFKCVQFLSKKCLFPQHAQVQWIFAKLEQKISDGIYFTYSLLSSTSYCNLGNHVRRRIHKLMTKFMLQVDVKIVQSYDTFKAISSNKEIFIDSICSKCCLRLLFMQRKFLFMKFM